MIRSRLDAGLAARRPRCWRAFLVLLLLHGPLSGMARAETRRVLVLSSSGRPFAPQSGFADALVPDLIRASREPLDLVEMSLQDARARGRSTDESIVQRVRSAFEGQRLDLVITIGGPAATFAQQHRQLLFPATPLLFAGVDSRFVENGTFTDNEATVAIQHEPALIIDEILRLLPETRTVVVVIGASPVEQFWLQQTKREFRRFDGRVRFVWTNELSLAEMMEGCRTLPPDSAIFFALLSVDAKGEPQVGATALASLHAVANAPMFALYDRDLGRGIVGGPLLSLDELSRTTVKVALRILAGESPRSIKTPVQRSGPRTFDWRELRRWNVQESRLTPGSVVLFREPPWWQRYRRSVILGSVIVGVPVAGLVLLVLAKHRARTELSNLIQHLMRTRERERAEVAKKLHNDVCQRIMAHTLRLKAVPRDGETQAVVDEISEQLASLVGEISKVPDAVYQKLEFLGLAVACQRLCEDLSAQHEVAIHFQHDSVPGNLPPDVALVLFRVLQEATANAVDRSARDISVSLRGMAAEMYLEIVASGAGGDPPRDDRGDDVWLVAIRERLKLVHGAAAIESSGGAGTRIVARVPLPSAN